jgi:hypothetical protein
LFAGQRPILGSIDHERLDLVLIELEPAPDGTPPEHKLDIDIATDWPNPSRTVFTVGYPGSPRVGDYPLTLLEQLFKSTFGHKRIAPGLVMASAVAIPEWTCAHDATTLGGNSGSVVLVAGHENLAAGLHYGGRYSEPRENWAHILGRTLEETDRATGRPLREILDEHGVNLRDSFA